MSTDLRGILSAEMFVPDAPRVVPEAEVAVVDFALEKVRFFARNYLGQVTRLCHSLGGKGVTHDVVGALGRVNFAFQEAVVTVAKPLFTAPVDLGAYVVQAVVQRRKRLTEQFVRGHSGCGAAKKGQDEKGREHDERESRRVFDFQVLLLCFQIQKE